MKIERLIVGELETNCYIIKKDNKCLIIDPGSEALEIEKKIDKLHVEGIIITHHHFDHIGAKDELLDFYKTKLYDINNLKEGKNKISDFEFDVIYTKGHKEDSISLLFEKNMFVGDFIFKDSIGRTDLPGGNMIEMKKSIERIKKYPKDIIIYPGHGEKTNLGDEIKYNYFFR